ncbi:LemA family protein [Emcibacter sp. SYSU 3D8]|uniref:LemA family protein n=1 Tax=Emcibacter sp. SYSU 3D8 TaxID=3133969 RepID=UPI0031FF309C
MLYALIAVGVLVLVFYMLYVKLITRRNNAREALSTIDVQLRQRHDLIPNVVTLAQKFMTHERELLESVVAARTQAQQPYRSDDPNAVREHLKAEQQLSMGLGRLLAIAENYPELRSSETIVTAQRTLNEVEGHIAAARRFYNSSVTDLNNAVEIFPSSLVAGMVGVQKMPFYEVEDAAARAPVNVADHMK